MVEVDVVSGQEEEDVVALEINGQDQPQTLYLMVEKGLGRERERERERAWFSGHVEALCCRETNVLLN